MPLTLNEEADNGEILNWPDMLLDVNDAVG